MVPKLELARIPVGPLSHFLQRTICQPCSSLSVNQWEEEETQDKGRKEWGSASTRMYGDGEMSREKDGKTTAW